VELWDWDRGSTDDSLGSFEVKIGEELLSQKVRERTASSVRRDGASGEIHEEPIIITEFDCRRGAFEASTSGSRKQPTSVTRRHRCSRVLCADSWFA